MAGNIAVIGTGYVGLTTGACLAHLGHDVVCADVDADKVARLERGEIPILEDGLEDLVRESTRAGRLRFVLGAANARASPWATTWVKPNSEVSTGVANTPPPTPNSPPREPAPRPRAANQGRPGVSSRGCASPRWRSSR